MNHYTVIGATGFIGARVLQRLLAAGETVYAPARGDPDVFVRDLGRVFYCAGLTGDYREKPFEAVEAHVSFLARLLESARFERLVYLSSTRLYDSLGGGHGREGDPLPLNASDPRHVYELSKMLGENLTLNQSNGRGCAARVAYVFDWEEGAAGFLSDWLAQARQTRSIQLDSGPSYARDYIHLDDVAQGLKAMLDVDGAGLVNLASGLTLSNQELAEVFEARGWSVTFARPAEPRANVTCDASRLADLGVTARDPRMLIDRYLAGLGA